MIRTKEAVAIDSYHFLAEVAGPFLDSTKATDSEASDILNEYGSYATMSSITREQLSSAARIELARRKAQRILGLEKDVEGAMGVF